MVRRERTKERGEFMLTINKTASYSAVDYAAEELKKYLRMMMPEGGDIKIAYNPEAKDGFRLGLMQDFGLDVSDAEDTELDDILYIDCTAEGGIIAGSNPRSVLLSVYEYLRQNGCRWLMPGVDGELIPIKSISPVKYRHKPSMRYRGWCNEGSEFQQCMLDAIDFLPKVGMNVFMMEFRIPTSYYKRYYAHLHNEENRPPEPITFDNTLQWKRMCETELARRGIQFHDIGHGWGADAFGIDSSVRKNDGKNDLALTDSQRARMALFDGRRQLRNDTPNYSQFCMGNPKYREEFTDYVCGYAQNHRNSDYFHVWLGDGFNCHCECELCKEKTASDWYVILLNELDEKLTARKLDCRIVFIAYTDTLWPPETEKIKNKERFTLLFAPIGRKYTETCADTDKDFTPTPFVRNKLVMPKNLGETFAYLDAWRNSFDGSAIAYEYHFWRHQYFDVGGVEIAKRVNEDVRAYLSKGISGIIQDGSQRSSFPTGFNFYTYARSMYDSSLTVDEIAEEYFSAAFGEDYKDFLAYLNKLSEAFNFNFMEGQLSANPDVGLRYNPKMVKSLESVRQITKEGRKLISAHYNSDYRVRTVSVRLLLEHADYADMLADACAAKAVANDALADELLAKLRVEFGKREKYIERYYDHGLVFFSLGAIFERRSKSELIIELDN